jgi:hypothetical protein
MPEIVIAGNPFTAASGNVVLNDPGTSAVGRWLVQIVATGGTFTVKPQKRLKPDAAATAQAFADCWYTLALTNAEIAAGTTQAANCIMDIDGSACDVQIAYTTAGGASLDIQATPLVG